MNLKEIARETLKIQRQGYYEINLERIDIEERQKFSEENSFLITIKDGVNIIKEQIPFKTEKSPKYFVVNQSTIKSISQTYEKEMQVAVLNFASAKNPGGGFLNGAIAQEEALAAASGLYNTLLRNENYYITNRSCGTGIYTDLAIYSPNVVFFRNSEFELLKKPITASVLTIPAINMGLVLSNRENIAKAKEAMKNRMRLILAIFAQQQNKRLILGAYGCGVFRNDPEEIALWWKELLKVEGYECFFEKIEFAVLDMTAKQENFSAFKKIFS